MAKVGLVFGGRSVEHLVSVQSARTVAQGLEAAGHRVVPLGIAEDGCFVGAEDARAALDGERPVLPAQGRPIRTTLGPLLEADVDLLFPIVHGTYGEDGSLQGLAEMLDLPYVGAGVAASAIAMDKLLCKRALEAAGIEVVEYCEVKAAAFAADPEGALAPARALPYPLFVKPTVGGSSVGIQRVGDPAGLAQAVAAALRFHDGVLLERGVKGRELECAVLGYRELEASVVGEIVPGRDFYDYEDKYLEEGAQLFAPADLADDVAARLRTTATRAMRAIGGEGMARVDFFLEGQRLYVNEINTLPGFTRISMYPRLWALSGRPLERLVDDLVALALERHRIRRGFDAEVRGFVEGIGGR